MDGHRVNRQKSSSSRVAPGCAGVVALSVLLQLGLPSGHFWALLILLYRKKCSWKKEMGREAYPSPYHQL